jgi:hypothetical protein
MSCSKKKGRPDERAPALGSGCFRAIPSDELLDAFDEWRRATGAVGSRYRRDTGAPYLSERWPLLFLLALRFALFLEGLAGLLG